MVGVQDQEIDARGYNQSQPLSSPGMTAAGLGEGKIRKNRRIFKQGVSLDSALQN
jgi:hypothetical protein